MFDYANYNQLSYLESTGTQFINTGVKVATNTAMEVDLVFTDSFSYNMAAGVWDKLSISNMAGSTICVSVAGSSANPLSGNYRLPTGERYLIKIDPAIKGLQINNSDPIIISSNTSNSVSTATMTIFGAVDEGTYINTGKNVPYAWGETYAKIRLFNFKLYSGSTLTHHLIPAQRRSDSTLGLYDEKNNVFYTNQGTGTFIAGDIVGGGNFSMNFKGPTSATDNTKKTWTDMIACTTTSSQTLTGINKFTHLGSAQSLNDEGMNPTEYEYTDGTGDYINTGSWDRISGASVIIENNITYGSSLTLSGLGVGGDIVGDNIYNAVWNDMVDCIPVQEDLELEYGKCYCFDGEKYYLSSRYLDDSIIGIHSDTAGFYVGSKPEKCLEVAVAGFALAYVDRPYKPGTPLTCMENGYLTEIKEEDIEKNPHKIVGTFWKEEWEEWWGFKVPQCDEHIVEVNGRMWIKIRR